ncbi:flippase-like domain-containing protein [Lysobacter sp. SG-8]|uniref:Flippase-like domain-containing protein n=1 Tax=Marilutibacter penaei TaxID=2759900 RepID=A0A7W3U468_9GAMM|nr:lysylphosphatidylglycerol synthase domain-containing protein [Lysobacter penaei]MBB1088588.1 flippase-like domain-containing protein [Lysobacter penaei]
MSNDQSTPQVRLKDMIGQDRGRRGSPTRRPRPLWLRIVSLCLVIVTLLWAAWLLNGAWGRIAGFVWSIQPGYGLGSFLLLLLSLLLSFAAFREIMESASGRSLGFYALGGFHFAGQLMKHIPGRFLGVAYQATNAAHLASPGQWVAANLAFMGLTIWMSLLVAVILILGVGPDRPMVVQSALLLLLLGPGPAYLLLARLRRKGMAGWVNHLHRTTRSPRFWKAILYMATSWAVYVSAWLAFSLASDDVSTEGALRLCAFYSISWVVGFVALVTPSGLGVRELTFAAFATGFPDPVVAGIAVLVRAAMLAGDLLLGVLFLPGVRNG